MQRRYGAKTFCQTVGGEQKERTHRVRLSSHSEKFQVQYNIDKNFLIRKRDNKDISFYTFKIVIYVLSCQIMNMICSSHMTMK